MASRRRAVEGASGRREGCPLRACGCTGSPGTRTRRSARSSSSPSFRCSLPTTRHPAARLARCGHVLARRPEPRDAVPVLRLAAGLAAARCAREVARQLLAEGQPVHGRVGLLRHLLPHRVLLRAARPPLPLPGRRALLRLRAGRPGRGERRRPGLASRARPPSSSPSRRRACTSPTRRRRTSGTWTSPPCFASGRSATRPTSW